MLVPLARPSGRSLDRVAVRLQGAFEIAGMIVHTKSARDHHRDAPQGPALGIKTGGPRTALDYSGQLLPLGRVQACRAAIPGSRRELCFAAMTPSGVPFAHRAAGDAQLARNLCIAEPTGAEELRRGRTSLFKLDRRQMPWSPYRHLMLLLSLQI